MDLSAALNDVNLPVPHEDGSFISEKVSRIVELIRDYDETLDVRWIRPDQRGPDEPAFAVVGKQRDGREYVLFYVQSEREFGGNILERIYQMDAAKHGNILSDIDARNAALQAIIDKEREDKIAEQIDVAYHILKSPKARYKHDGVVYE